MGATASQDTTNVRFGTASLKLTATASTVSVELGSSGYPFTLPPNWKWIASVYLKPSRGTVNATLETVTPNGSYTGNVSGDLGTDWSRLYADHELTADAATTGTLKLTFTGVTVGDTFNLEAWQLEPVQGNTALPSPYIITSPPRTWAQVVDDGAKPENNATLGADLATNVTNNTLDHVNDSGTYARMPVATTTGTGTSRRALIDFSQSHANKSQDYLPDGSTYARIKATELSSGRHRIGVAGSGFKAGDARNLPGSQVLGYGGVVTGTPLTASSTGTVSVNAHTV